MSEGGYEGGERDRGSEVERLEQIKVLEGEEQEEDVG